MQVFDEKLKINQETMAQVEGLQERCTRDIESFASKVADCRKAFERMAGDRSYSVKKTAEDF